MIRKRKNIWIMHRRVPSEFSDVEPRKMITDSLHTESKTEAMIKAIALWDHKIDGWTALKGSHFQRAEEKFRQARAIAMKSGFNYMAAPQVAELAVTDILNRVEAIDHKDEKNANALLGGAPEPEITIDEALSMFWKLKADAIIGKTPDQLRRYRNPRILVISTLINLIGDKPLSQITRDDMLLFRDMMITRVKDVNDKFTAETANKQTAYLSGVFNFVNKMKKLELDLPISGLTITGHVKVPKDPFSTEWITTKILAPDALIGLNDEARAILLMTINTGARPSEIAGLLPHHFLLDAPIPMVQFEPEDRQLKNKHSRRKVPLDGVSLDAAREFAATGFPRYFGRDGVTDTINKYLETNGLKETPKTTSYSLRHSFEDRMLVAGIDERVRSDIFGHTLQRERYGVGGGDELRYEAIKKVAL